MMDAPAATPRGAPRRTGLLPSVLSAALLYELVADPMFRRVLLAAWSEVVLIAFCAPLLLGACLLMVAYTMTVLLQPNTLGPIDWFTAAFIMALLASLCMLGGSPLLDQLAAVAGLGGQWHLAVNVTLPVPLLHATSSVPA